MKDNKEEKSEIYESFTKHLKIAITRESDPSKEELFAILHWFRQIIGFIFGIIAGFYHFTGILVIAVFMAFNMGLTYFYSNNFLGVDEDKFEKQELYTEGMGNSFAAFLLSWILGHTFFPY